MTLRKNQLKPFRTFRRPGPNRNRRHRRPVRPTGGSVNPDALPNHQKQTGPAEMKIYYWKQRNKMKGELSQYPANVVFLKYILRPEGQTFFGCCGSTFPRFARGIPKSIGASSVFSSFRPFLALTEKVRSALSPPLLLLLLPRPGKSTRENWWKTDYINGR